MNTIGIFDSGIGGLTVFKEIRHRFPRADIFYFGDTARLPYGPKSKHTVINYSVQNTRFLVQQSVEVVVVACNTASSVALETLQTSFSVPIIGVIEAGAKVACQKTKCGKIGIIATEGTINSRAYEFMITQLSKDLQVFVKACPLFVPLAEEGWIVDSISKQIAHIYLDGLVQEGIDTLVLGCTHYPILKNIIQEVCGSDVFLVDSAAAVTDHLLLLSTEVTNNNTNNTLYLVDKNPSSIDLPVLRGKNHFFVSDLNTAKYQTFLENILQIKDYSLQEVKIGETWYL